MTDEREYSGRDAHVADLYRDLADESTPQHLDDKVLRMAAREGRTRYSLVRGWMRPAAWAATIGLSLVIVMELTLFSTIDPDYVQPAAVEPTPGRSDAKEAAPLEAASALPDEAGTGEMRPVAKRSRAPDGDDADDLVPQTLTIVRDAEELARVQAGPDQPVASVEEKQEAPQADIASSTAFAAGAMRAEGMAVAAGCSAGEREAAESWHACIERLREQGQDELAEEEEEAFVDEYPDYEPDE